MSFPHGLRKTNPTILALPVGTFIPLLKNQGTVGSFGNIYESIENLSITYLQLNMDKETLLKPKVHISGGTITGTGVSLNAKR